MISVMYSDIAAIGVFSSGLLYPVNYARATFNSSIELSGKGKNVGPVI